MLCRHYNFHGWLVFFLEGQLKQTLWATKVRVHDHAIPLFPTGQANNLDLYIYDSWNRMYFRLFLYLKKHLPDIIIP